MSLTSYQAAPPRSHKVGCEDTDARGMFKRESRKFAQRGRPPASVCRSRRFAQACDGPVADCGYLPSGGRLLLNKTALEADLLVAEGFIEPHFFAGFSGGRKSVLPGIAGRRTVLYNHPPGLLGGR